jgi:hypothetical protein
VYRREAGSLEKFFSGAETQLYYEVQMAGERFALNVNAFKSQPLELCIQRVSGLTNRQYRYPWQERWHH